jgi:glycerol uptake facilitator-like aquaporin
MVRWRKVLPIVIGQVLYAIAAVWVYEVFFHVSYIQQKPDGTVIMSDQPNPCQTSKEQ